MIKVEHTKTHQVTKRPWDGKKVIEALVTDAKLVLVECKPEEALFFYSVALGMNSYSFSQGLVKGIGVYIKPVLISKTEKIEVGDWYLNSEDELFMCGRDASEYIVVGIGCRKVLALPEYFSLQQLQDIVDGKLKDGDKVLVECETFKIHPEWDKPIGAEYSEERIKLNPHITIYPVEERLYTREEVITILNDFVFKEITTQRYKLSFLNQWFEQNVK